MDRLGDGAPIEDPDGRSPLRVALDASADADADGSPDRGRGHAVYATARIGLTLKRGRDRGAAALHRAALPLPHRAGADPKGKPYLIAALHLQGRSPEEIAAVTRTRRAVIDGHLAAFEAGRALRLAELGGDLASPAALCRLLGAAAASE